MRLSLIICSLLFTAVTRCAARKDLEETCFYDKSCVLSCHIQEALSEVLWSKDMLAVQCFPSSQSFHQHVRYRNRTSLFVHEIHNGNCSLTINNVKPQDSGIYKCVHTNQRRDTEWLFYNLTVNAPVEAVVIEQSGDVLICSSERVHPKPECHWSGASSNTTVQQDDQLLYSISCTTPLLHNIPRYDCTVSTPFSSKTATYIQLHSLVNTAIAVVLTIILTFLTFGVYICVTYCLKTRNMSPQSQTTAEAPVSDPQSGPSAEPQDRCHGALFICFLLGLGSALPWDFFVTASLYFHQRTLSQGQRWVLSLIVLVSLLPHLISEGFNSYFGFRVSPQKHTSCCLFTIMLFFVAMLVSIKAPMSGDTFFGVSMCALWFGSLFSSRVQRSLSVEVNLLPQKHRQSLAFGQASAGISASLAMIVCVAVTDDEVWQVFGHFLGALVVSMAAFVAHVVLIRCEFAKYHFNQERRVKKEEIELLASDDKKNDEDQERPQAPDGLLTNRKGKLCVASVQILTFSVYPAITADVHTVYSEKWGRYFILVCCFLTFHVVHLVSQWVPISWARKHFLIVFPIFVVIHAAFTPLFMFCNVQPRAFLPVSAHLSNDMAFTFIMALFSLSHGFLTQLSQLNESGASAGISNVLWRALGGTIGALLSFGVRAAISNSK